MTSHKEVSGFSLTVGKGGVRFTKRPSAYNVCVGNALKGGEGPTHGGRYDKGWQAKFTSAVKSCAGHKMKKVM
jgi:hypothetical protein